MVEFVKRDGKIEQTQCLHEHLIIKKPHSAGTDSYSRRCCTIPYLRGPALSPAFAPAPGWQAGSDWLMSLWGRSTTCQAGSTFHIGTGMIAAKARKGVW